ncbi:SxtJ family membrane protein [Pseudobdellovibrio exovorus]|uniref:SxtJ n=1 Tax=Pseudobdellovibrio exovorus JSS TaxID=1184267 RepID=M4VU14_9BACT|nr:SxtJ family membrane protein [Pseudobdellovibrio exovorus]AGH96709.1 hypothetical protein A11Q_2493 [Pseudobdellovibrio exovorus JSS]
MNQKNHSHENYERTEKVRLGSEKNFGLTFAVLFLILAIAPLLFQHPLRLWALITSAVLALISFTFPQLFKYSNRYWLKFGMLLGKIVSPVVLGLLFFLIFWPIGLLLKIFGKDVLNLKLQATASSYWIKSEEGLSTMKDQF